MIVYLYDCDCGKCYDVVNATLFEAIHPDHILNFGFACDTEREYTNTLWHIIAKANVVVVGTRLAKNRYGAQNTVEEYNHCTTHPDQPKINIKSIRQLSLGLKDNNNEFSLEQETKDGT